MDLFHPAKSHMISASVRPCRGLNELIWLKLEKMPMTSKTMAGVWLWRHSRSQPFATTVKGFDSNPMRVLAVVLAVVSRCSMA